MINRESSVGYAQNFIKTIATRFSKYVIISVRKLLNQPQMLVYQVGGSAALPQTLHEPGMLLEPDCALFISQQIEQTSLKGLGVID